jgi:hypothetical protein
MKLIYTIFCYFYFIGLTLAQNNYPVPKITNTRLFYIQHSLSKNTYVYDVNLNGNIIDVHNPIHVYRILYEDNGQVANLTMPQRKLAYGYNAERVNDKLYKFNIVAYKNQKMNLVNRNQKFVVETIVNNKPMILERMFIQIKPNSHPLKVDVDYILFTGIDSKSGKKLTEKFVMPN